MLALTSRFSSSVNVSNLSALCCILSQPSGLSFSLASSMNSWRDDATGLRARIALITVNFSCVSSLVSLAPLRLLWAITMLSVVRLFFIASLVFVRLLCGSIIAVAYGLRVGRDLCGCRLDEILYCGIYHRTLLACRHIMEVHC